MKACFSIWHELMQEQGFKKHRMSGSSVQKIVSEFHRAYSARNDACSFRLILQSFLHDYIYNRIRILAPVLQLFHYEFPVVLVFAKPLERCSVQFRNSHNASTCEQEPKDVNFVSVSQWRKLVRWRYECPPDCGY